MIDLLDDGLLDVAAKGGDAELEAWASEQGAAPKPPEGTCGICGTRPAKRRCQACEAPVCAADSWSMFGLCRRCATPERIAAWHKTDRATGGNWLEGP